MTDQEVPMKRNHSREPVRMGEVFPDIYDLWKAATAAARVEAARGAQARTDAETATAAAKGNADV